MKFPGIVIGDTLTSERTVTKDQTVGSYWKTHVEELLSTPRMVEIKSFDGYHIRLQMVATDESEVVGRGSHMRSIVNKKWLLIKLNRRLMNRPWRAW